MSPSLVPLFRRERFSHFPHALPRKKSPSCTPHTQRKKNRAEKAYVVARKNTVKELQRADDNEEGHEDVDELRALRGVVDVVVVDVGEDLIPVLGAAALCCRSRAGLGLRGHGSRDGGGGGRSCGRRGGYCYVSIGGFLGRGGAFGRHCDRFFIVRGAVLFWGDLVWSSGSGVVDRS